MGVVEGKIGNRGSQARSRLTPPVAYFALYYVYIPTCR